MIYPVSFRSFQSFQGIKPKTKEEKESPKETSQNKGAYNVTRRATAIAMAALMSLAVNKCIKKAEPNQPGVTPPAYTMTDEEAREILSRAYEELVEAEESEKSEEETSTTEENQNNTAAEDTSNLQ